MMNNEKRREAGVVLALATCRGALYSVRQGEIDMDELDRVIASTASERIATILGIKEEDFVQDWAEILSEKEIEGIKGLK